jgi:Taurine catabolism dioxygenase TauD, TfdA family
MTNSMHILTNMTTTIFTIVGFIIAMIASANAGVAAFAPSSLPATRTTATTATTKTPLLRMPTKYPQRSGSVVTITVLNDSEFQQQPQPQVPIDGGRNLLATDPQILATHGSECQGLSTPLMPSRDHVVETSLIPFNSGGGTSSEVSDQAVYVFPLVVQPKQYCVRFCLRAFLEANKEWVDKQILQYGAVLFRGFDITSAAEVEANIRAFESNLSNEYRGTSPRMPQDGSSYVFSAAEVPSHFPIAQHLEMSFLPSPPKRLFFSALKAPSGKVGGATAMTDFRKVYRDMPKHIIQKMASKRLKYTRTHYKKGASPLFTNDITALNSWSDVFGTTNKTKIEEICKREGTPMKWTGRNNDVFVSEYTSDAVQLHPQTKEPVWFNHAQGRKCDIRCLQDSDFLFSIFII